MSAISSPAAYRVMVVDDDPQVLPLIDRMLTHGGYQPEMFSSPVELLRSVREDDVGCVVTDLQMPGISGIELQNRLNELGSCLSIVVISGQADVSSTIKLMSRGAVTLLEKPFKSTELVAEVQHAIRLSQERQERKHRIMEARRAINSLSEEELEIMKMGARGLPNKAVSHELALSNRTVDRRRQSAFSKLAVRSEAEFALLAATADEKL
ncbi:MAG: response regulator transcription factor [Aureliella sp.]